MCRGKPSQFSRSDWVFELVQVFSPAWFSRSRRGLGGARREVVGVRRKSFGKGVRVAPGCLDALRMLSDLLRLYFLF